VLKYPVLLKPEISAGLLRGPCSDGHRAEHGARLRSTVQEAEQELIDATEPALADPGEKPAKTRGMAIRSQDSEYHRWRASARKGHLSFTGPGDVKTGLLVTRSLTDCRRCRGGASATEALKLATLPPFGADIERIVASPRCLRILHGEGEGRRRCPAGYS
jgi:hypothetical protein